MPQAPGFETVSVRMYRGLLGDCFLLTHRRDAERYHALIDCGVLQAMGAVGAKPNTRKALAHIDDVVADLTTATGGALDLVVATHEHYDHLSGFMRNKAVFDGFDIKAVWMGWTENPLDAYALDIAKRGRDALSALQTVIKERARFAIYDGAQARIDAIEALMQFHGEVEPWSPAATPFAAAPKKPRKPWTPLKDDGATPNSMRACADVFDWLRWRATEFGKKAGRPAEIRYLEPGEIVSFGIEGRLKANVLGPSRRGDRLRKLNPTESLGDAKEVYLTHRDDVVALETTLKLHPAMQPATPALAPSASTEPGDVPRPQRPPAGELPFGPRFDRKLDETSTDWLATLYFQDDESAPAQWRNPEGQAHPDDDEKISRRIDGEWLGAAEMLALKIDGDVNNTSLALAVETPGRHVLLFAADAQVGNWESWHDQTYPVAAKKDEPEPATATSLLNRTILYKVGHHGSHNATAKALGLELMTSRWLCAMIPVVTAVAAEQGKGWAMPYADLDKRLKERAHERVLQGDGDHAKEVAAFTAAPCLFSLPNYGPPTPADPNPLWVELTADMATLEATPALG